MGALGVRQVLEVARRKRMQNGNPEQSRADELDPGGIGGEHGDTLGIRQPQRHSQSRVRNFTDLPAAAPAAKMTIRPMRLIRYLRDAALLVPCYIALDWASYIDPVGPFNITPWNPQPALAIVWMMLGGLAYAPAVFGAIAIADIVIRHAPGGYAITLLGAVLLAGGYAAIAWQLRSMLRDTDLRSTRQLTVFAAVMLGGTAIVGGAFVGMLKGAGLLGATPLEAWLRFWIGDAVG